MAINRKRNHVCPEENKNMYTWGMAIGGAQTKPKMQTSCSTDLVNTHRRGKYMLSLSGGGVTHRAILNTCFFR